jgi:homogentisate 1,2-dioxygenase
MSRYMTGLGNHFSTEAIKGALPLGQNSPQRIPYGLYAEQFSGTAFTAPRKEARRTWFYRLHPSANHNAFGPYAGAKGWSPKTVIEPNRLRWGPLSLPIAPTDFIDGLISYALTPVAKLGEGVAISLFACNRSMSNRAFFNADAEMLIVPQRGALSLWTECGVLEVEPLSICVIPRGMRFRVDLKSETACGYVLENYGLAFRLPDLGPIGSNGLANPRDFEIPKAEFEDIDQPFELIQKFSNAFYTTSLDHSPFDVVAWHGNLCPYRYDLRRFNTINTVSYDHPDPSIFTVLTAPSDTEGVANADFVIFPPRWMVAEHTFRPPWFHRNIMSEFMGLITGSYDAKAEGFVPGGASLHPPFSAHGPDKATYEIALSADLKPHKIEETMAFMFETRHCLNPTPQAVISAHREVNYDHVWSDFKKATLPQ